MFESLGMQELLNHYHENKLSHAFLIETNNQEKCLQNLLQFLSYINKIGDEEEDVKLSQLIENESLPSLVVIRPDGINIKKEQILELKRFFQTKPTFSRYNMYIMMSSETLNAVSANTMLKFLEEPEEGILGFFITNNKENIIDTIKSRCQIVADFYEMSESKNIPQVWYAIAINYIKEFELVGDEALLYNKNVIVPLVHDKKECFYLFQTMFNIYSDLYMKKQNDQEIAKELEVLAFVLKKDVSYFLSQLQYLARLIEELNYNVNLSLFLDRFVLEGR